MVLTLLYIRRQWRARLQRWSSTWALSALEPARAYRASAPRVVPLTHAQLTTPNQYSLPIFTMYDFDDSVIKLCQIFVVGMCSTFKRLFSHLRPSSCFNNNVFYKFSCAKKCILLSVVG